MFETDNSRYILFSTSQKANQQLARRGSTVRHALVLFYVCVQNLALLVREIVWRWLKSFGNGLFSDLQKLLHK